MSSQSDSSSRRRHSVVPLEDAPAPIVLDADPAQLTDSHASTVELQHLDGLSPIRGSSIFNVNEDKTIISKRVPAEEAPPAIHIGPLESRKSLEGETLDHFQLEKYVGGGGMGAVYRAQDMRLNRHVAVKVLSRDQSDSETVRRFRNEAQSAARLDDPHIARVYYIGEDKGWNFIVFEFIEGTNLRELVEERGPLPIEEALDYTLQVCEAIGHAADRDVVHRDIKPSNVLVTGDGGVKLVDMGLARLHQVESGSEDLTQSGVTLGTFDYISPEQARDPRLADVRSDIYSLGCTLYFMLAGRAPFPDGTALQKLIRHNSDDPPDLRLFRPDTPDEVVAILSRMLAKKPEQRFQRPAEIMLAINRLSQRLNLTLGASSSRLPIKWPQPIAEPAPWWQRLMPLAIAALVLLTLALLPERWPGQEDDALSLPRIAGPVVNKPVEPETPSPKKDEPTELPPETIPATAKTDEIEIKPLVPKVEEAKPAVATLPMAPMGKKDPLDTLPRIDSPIIDSIVTPVASATQRVVVGASAEEGAVAEAFRYASEHPDVEEIELAFNGKKTISKSLDIASKRLAIRAAAGFKPELVFQPSKDYPSDDRRMIRLTMPGGHVTWQGVRMRFDVPRSDNEWVLFQYSAEAKLELTHCVLSIANTSPALIRHSPKVSFFEPGLRAATTTETRPLRPAPPEIEIQQCVLRGDATVIRLSDDAPLRCQILDSFIATADRLLETGGSNAQPGLDDAIALDLERSTIVATSGLLLCGAQLNRQFHLRVRVTQISCVVVADSSFPVVEFRESGASEEPPFTFGGSNNFYPRSTVFFRHSFRADGVTEPKDFGLFGSLPRWAVELNTFPGTLAGGVPESPFQDHLPSDYVLKSPADTNAGCTLALLPAVESTVRRPIMGASTMGTMKPDPLMPTMSDDKPSTRPAP